MKGIVNTVDSLERITVIDENREFYHSHGRSYKELSEKEIILHKGDSVEFEVNEKITAHITKIERTGIKDMKKEILQGIEEIKGMRADCIAGCEKICKDADLSHEGKINRMNQAIAGYSGKRENPQITPSGLTTLWNF